MLLFAYHPLSIWAFYSSERRKFKRDVWEPLKPVSYAPLSLAEGLQTEESGLSRNMENTRHPPSPLVGKRRVYPPLSTAETLALLWHQIIKVILRNLFVVIAVIRVVSDAKPLHLFSGPRLHKEPIQYSPAQIRVLYFISFVLCRCQTRKKNVFDKNDSVINKKNCLRLTKSFWLLFFIFF